MTTTPVYHGVKVHWGTTSTGVTTVIGTFALQGRDHNLGSDADVIQNGNGFALGKTYFNHNEAGTFDYIPYTAATPAGDLTPTIPAVGTMIVVTDTVYTAISGSQWMVDSISTKSSNTAAMRVSLGISRYGGITQ